MRGFDAEYVGYKSGATLEVKPTRGGRAEIPNAPTPSADGAVDEGLRAGLTPRPTR
jgi:hypothetical protein